MEHYSIDIESRFQKAELLNLSEITSLRDYCKNQLSPQHSPSKIVSIKRKNDGHMKLVDRYSKVHSSTQYNRRRPLLITLSF